MRFIIIEVGSTNTKCYLCDNKNIEEVKTQYIGFKVNYQENGKILESDLNTLYSLVEEMKQYSDSINVYGTSIFRNLSETEKENFLSNFKFKTGYDFNIVSADQENEYTVYGVINNNNYIGKLAVMIGGGGSTEISIVDNKKIISKINLPFGAMDIASKYKDLALDKATSDFDEILEYTKSLIGSLEEESDVLVLSGGNYSYFYKAAHYNMDKNNIYYDNNQPFIIDINKSNGIDRDFHYNGSLEQMKLENADNIGWWNGGVRGMRMCVHALAYKLNTKYIIPTSITMVYGIASMLKDNYN